MLKVTNISVHGSSEPLEIFAEATENEIKSKTISSCNK
jgi:hypothetical protein